MRTSVLLPWSSRSVALVVLIAATTGCAGFAKWGLSEAPEPLPLMDQARLEQIFSDQVEAITGPAGALQTKIDGISVYCISDPVNDRMRFIAPIARITHLDPRLLGILLRANFDSTRDARYAISDDVVFAAFVHPISSLSDELIESALSQVVSLVKTFGTTFSGIESSSPESAPEASEQEAEEAQSLNR